MRLVERKCPNCGAGISFNKEDKEVECNYCHAYFDVERGPEDITENFVLHAKTVRTISKGIFIFVGVVMIISLIIFFLVFFNITKHFM